MNKKIVSSFLILAFVMVPGIGLAAGIFGDAPGIVTQESQLPGGGNAISFIALLIGKVLDLLWIVFIALSIIMFIVAGFQFLAAQGEPDGVTKAKKSVLWGAIGVAVAVAAFSIPFIIRSRLGL